VAIAHRAASSANTGSGLAPMAETVASRRLQGVLLRRWVERAFAWLSHNRRMGKDYERLCSTGEAFVYVAMSCLW
jgi:transposase